MPSVFSNQTATIERATSSVDSTGGVIRTGWAYYVYDAVSGSTTQDLPCSVWPIMTFGTNDTRQEFNAPQALQEYNFDFWVDPKVQQGDRISWNGDYYQVRGNSQLFSGVPGMEHPCMIRAARIGQ